MIKFTEYIVYNSITNTLTDNKFDVDKPFSFIEYLNYVKVIDNNDIENFSQYKKYLEKWKETDFINNKDNSLNIKAIYLNFFNDLTLKYSTQEQRRFFNTIDLYDNGSLTKIIPFYRNKIVEILNYYREKRNTFQKELREKTGKGSNISVKDQIKNNIINFFNSPDYQGEVVNLSSLRVDMELGFDDFNDYFDINPDSVPANETYISNDINANAFIDIDKALIEVLNDNNITITELNPYKLIIEFNQANTAYLQRDDFIDYKITNSSDTYRILFEAELAENLVGTDYFYLSTTETEYVSGKLFEAKNKAKNLFNINFPSTLAKEKSPSKYERGIGLYFNPTKFSILRVDGEYITKVKKELKENFVYVFQDPNQYGDVVNLSNVKRDNPFNFYFDESSYKNVSSSSSRKSVKPNDRNHYFHSYQSVENKRINITNDGNFNDSITDLINKGSVDKIETDIYGNEYVQIIPNKGIIRNYEDRTLTLDNDFQSGKTVTTSENKYGGESLSGLSDKIYSFKEIFIKDAVTKELTPLSNSKFNLIYDKFKSNSILYNQILNNEITDINVYEDTISIDLSSFSIIDTFKYDGNYIELATSPLIIEKDNTNISFITPDCYHNNSIYKFNINLNNFNSPNNNSFYFELFKYDTNKKVIEEVSTRNTETSSYFKETFTFNNSIEIKSIDNSILTYNSYDNSFLLTTSFIRENINDNSDSFCIHYLNFKIINNKIVLNKNHFYTNYNDNNIPIQNQKVINKSLETGNISLLSGNNDINFPTISFPTTNSTTSLTIAYSGTVDANFVFDNVVQNSSGLSLYKADFDFGDGTTQTRYSSFLSTYNYYFF